MSAVAGRSPLHVGGLSDDELVHLARGGHEPAFDAIVHRYRAPLVSYCRRWVDPDRAEEVVQYTLMKAFVCLRDDDRPLALRAWLYRVAHNAALNALEKKGSDWEELDENYDGVPQPPYVAEQRARFLQVVDGIGALPTRQRDALVLNEFEGRCYAEIAAELGTSESGVRGLLRRARLQLRDTAAAALFPFAALRELLRSDAGRFQVDRAGELIGSAGAVGGVGAAGGLSKVAAGVLAAGTIAGGGTAIEHQQESFRAPEPKAAAAATPATSVAAPVRSLLRPAGADEADTLPVGPLVLTGGGLMGGGGFPVERQGARESFGGIEEPAADDGGGEVVASDPAPVVPTQPTLPLAGEPEPPPAEDEDGGQLPDDGEKAASDPAGTTEGGDEPEQPASDGESTPTESGQTQEEPSATPAAPIAPQVRR